MSDSLTPEHQPDLTKKEVFESVFRKHYLMLKNYAWQYVLEEDVAEDIVQDVFVHLWERRNSLQLKVSVKSYLFTSVYNRCLNRLKHEKVSLTFKKIKTEEEKVRIAFYENSPSDKMKIPDEEFAKKIKQSIEDLPEQQQRVIILSRKFNLKNKEIAEFLNISVKAVEKNMSKALHSLRSKLKNFLIFITM